MQFEIAYEEIIAFANVADVTGQIIVQKDALSFVLGTDLVVNKVALSKRVVMVEGIHTLSLCEKVVDILLNIEAVHENKSRRFSFFE